MEYARKLDLMRERKSLFLFGPRLTGKTYLLKKTFPEARYYDLLRSDTFLRLALSETFHTAGRACNAAARDHCDHR